MFVPRIHKSKMLFFFNLNLNVWQRSIYIYGFQFTGITNMCLTKEGLAKELVVTLRGKNCNILCTLSLSFRWKSYIYTGIQSYFLFVSPRSTSVLLWLEIQRRLKQRRSVLCKKSYVSFLFVILYVKYSINAKVQTDSVMIRAWKTFNSSLDILLVIDIHYVKCVVLEGFSALY